MRPSLLPSWIPGPGSGPRRRRASRVAALPVAGAVALALGAGLLTGQPALADDASGRGHGPANTAWPTAKGNPGAPGATAKALENAKSQAKKTKKQVAVDELTTGNAMTVANPDGTFTTDTAPVAQRVKGADGKWRGLDATLRTNADGTVTPTASASKLSFSGGGTGPMATMTTADGRKLSLKAPFPLPKPQLGGDSALYKGVLPDVDLRLTATPAGGWRQVLVVRTAQAAADPAVKKLQLAVEADGLTVTADKAGNLKATDDRGKTRFTAPTPLMWDSATTPAAAEQAPAAKSGTARSLAAADGAEAPAAEAPAAAAPAAEQPPVSSADGPGQAAAVAAIGTTTDSKTIQLVPDTAVLGKGTGPWYIDPGWNPDVDNGTQAWSQVQEAYPDTNEYNGTADGQDKPATGYCGYSTCTRKGKERAYFQVGINSVIHGAVVLDARLYATVVASSSPTTSTPMGLYWTPPISSPTSWNRQPCGTGSTMAGCSKIGITWMKGSGEISFDVKGQMEAAARDKWGNFTFGLAPDDEGNMYYRQRFSNTPHIKITYDIKPTIWWPRTSPTPGFADTASYADCFTPGTAHPWDNPGWVGANTNITLTSNTYSATNRQLMTTFQYWDDDDGGKTYYASTNWNGSYGPATVDIGRLNEGHQYGWTSRTTDETLTSGDSDWCFFRVDRTPPTAAVSSTDFPESGTIGGHPKLVGQEGLFTLTGTDPAPAAGGRSSGMACARWTTDPVKAAATNWKCTDTDPGVTKLVGGAATIKVTPQRWGTNFVYLQTQDVAGNLSQPVAYSYYAPSNPNSPAPIFGDADGDKKADVLLPDTAGSLRQIGGGTDPAAAPNARIKPAPGNNGWNGIQITHRGSLGFKDVDDLIAHQPGNTSLHLYTNNGAGLFDTQAAATITKPSGCTNPAGTTIDCAAHGYGTNWANVSQIAAFGSPNGDTPDGDGALPRTSLLFVENGRLWLGVAGSTNQLAAKAILLSANDQRWDGYELIAPGRAQGTAFPTLWARSKTDGSLHAFSVKGTADDPDLTGFTDPAAGPLTGRIDPAAYPRAGSNGDLNGDGLPDLWAVDANQQLVAFNGTGTAGANPTVTGFDTATITLGNLNMPKAQWKLTGQTGATTPSAVGNFPATAAGITWPTEKIGGRDSAYASFNGTGSSITTAAPVIDTRNSFTISTWVKAKAGGGAIISQDLNNHSSLLVFPNHNKKVWQFALANGDSGSWPYDETNETNSAATLALDTWTRLTAVYDQTTGLMRLYVNGALAATGHHKASTSPAPVGPFQLGRFKLSGAYANSPFTGGISNVAVYPYAASPAASGTSGKISYAPTGTNCADLGPDGTKVQIWDCNEIGGGLAQKFEVRGDGTVRIQGKCMDAKDAGTANSTLIQAVTCHDHPAQQFLPRADGSLYNPVSGRCVDLDHGNTTNGVQLWLYDCNSSPAQRWTIPTLATAPLPVPNP
ncbi:LamG-like jellyroll fold domain-containing protein [Streptomyces sp. NPDC057011]|uniref:LamG-like jellyroll fold domain-containing protein n=1 Tax=unclassified Streptomyces TaxID=2593676 RepID=UPI003634F136